MTDTDRINFIAECARYGRTGVVFEWDGHGHYRFKSRHDLGPAKDSIRDAIDTAMKELSPRNSARRFQQEEQT